MPRDNWKATHDEEAARKAKSNRIQKYLPDESDHRSRVRSDVANGIINVMQGISRMDEIGKGMGRISYFLIEPGEGRQTFLRKAGLKPQQVMESYLDGKGVRRQGIYLRVEARSFLQYCSDKAYSLQDAMLKDYTRELADKSNLPLPRPGRRR